MKHSNIPEGIRCRYCTRWHVTGETCQRLADALARMQRGDEAARRLAAEQAKPKPVKMNRRARRAAASKERHD